MSIPIEDYAMIGDCHTAALVSKLGSIDWLCSPHFDAAACFAALLGDAENGHWSITPAEPIRSIRRRYREGTLILETEFATENGSVTLVDFMTPRNEMPELGRLVVGTRGQVQMNLEIVIRFDYGSVVPWVRRTTHGISAIAGPDMLGLRTEVPLRGENFKTVAGFAVVEGQEVPFDLTWYPSHQDEPLPLNVEAAMQETEDCWREWSSRCSYQGKWRDAVLRSLITLKALTFLPTGGSWQRQPLHFLSCRAAKELGLPPRDSGEDVAQALLEFLETGGIGQMKAFGRCEGHAVISFIRR